VPNTTSSGYRDRFPSQDNKTLCATCEESGEFVSEDTFNIIGLLDFDTDPDSIDGWLNENVFILITSNMHRIQDDL
jgi:hypothetical protein